MDRSGAPAAQRPICISHPYWGSGGSGTLQDIGNFQAQQKAEFEPHTSNSLLYSFNRGGPPTENFFLDQIFFFLLPEVLKCSSHLFVMAHRPPRLSRIDLYPGNIPSNMYFFFFLARRVTSTTRSRVIFPQIYQFELLLNSYLMFIVMHKVIEH